MFFINRVNKVYKNESYGIKRKAPAFEILSIVCLVFITLIFIIKIINKDSLILNINVIIIIIAIIISQFALLNGKYDRAIYYFSIGIFIALTISMLMESVTYIQIPYRHAINYMLLIISTGMISNSLRNLVVIYISSIISFSGLTLLAINRKSLIIIYL